MPSTPSSPYRRLRARLRPLRARAQRLRRWLAERIEGVGPRLRGALRWGRLVALPRSAAERDVRALIVRHVFGRSSVLGDGPRVSLTSFGWRLDTVHLAIESIGRGAQRPRALTLWLEEPPTGRVRRRLRRLQRRGLRIRLTEGYGPHTKYYPELLVAGGTDEALVTADDDMVYPVGWLRQLAAAAVAEPDLIHCHRAHRVLASGESIAPYTEWSPVTDRVPRLGNLATGVSGVIYPPRVLRALADRGTAFRADSPTADDIWIHSTAVRAGVRTRQVADVPQLFPAVPGTQVWGLYAHNVVGGANDVQIRASYPPEAVAAIREEQASAGPA